MIKFSPKIKEFAEKQNAKALCLMGMIHRWGIGTAVDPVKSGEYTRRAADQGYPKGILCYAFYLQDIVRN
jgi:TPR repeat protein